MSCKLRTVYLNRVCQEVNKLYLPFDKKDTDKTVQMFQLTSTWTIKSDKIIAEHCILLFSLVYHVHHKHDKSTEWKTCVLLSTFFQQPLSERKVLFMEFLPTCDN